LQGFYTVVAAITLPNEKIRQNPQGVRIKRGRRLPQYRLFGKWRDALHMQKPLRAYDAVPAPVKPISELPRAFFRRTFLQDKHMIQLININKTYKTIKRSAGLFAALKSLFHKEYEYIRALEDVSFTINEGETVALLGPNGAGKSTMIKMMRGMVVPDSGECIVCGLTPWKSYQAHQKNIGAVFGQNLQLWPDAPVLDSFELLKKQYGIKPSDYKRSLNELTETLDISAFLAVPAKDLSPGQRMRCEIAASLLHNPKILFLDEPLNGVDAESRNIIIGFLIRIRQERKTTIVLSSSDTQDIEPLAERVLLMDEGRILFDGPLAALKKRCPMHKKVTVEFAAGDFEPAAGIALEKKISGFAVFTVDTDKIPMPDAISLLSKRAEIISLSVAGASAAEIAARFKRAVRAEN